jgi:hypothetical protein
MLLRFQSSGVSIRPTVSFVVSHQSTASFALIVTDTASVGPAFALNSSSEAIAARSSRGSCYSAPRRSTSAAGARRCSPCTRGTARARRTSVVSTCRDSRRASRRRGSSRCSVARYLRTARPVPCCTRQPRARGTQRKPACAAAFCNGCSLTSHHARTHDSRRDSASRRHACRHASDRLSRAEREITRGE